MELHGTVCTSRVDASIVAETHAVGRRRVRRNKKVGTMMLATLLQVKEVLFIISIYTSRLAL